MAINYMGQLKDRSADKRKEAIKAAARAADKKALKTLAIMVEDDPDAEVRALAKRAGVHIRQQIGELPMTPASTGKDGETVAAKYNVAADNVTKASKQLDAAVTLIMSGASSKALKPLRAALALNPNLRYDGYFKSVVENATGLSGEEALEQISDAKVARALADRELSIRKQNALNDHMSEVKKGAWGGVAFALFMLFFVAMAGSFFASVMFTTSAAGYVQRVYDNWGAYDEAKLRGETTEYPDGRMTFLDPTQVTSMGRPREVDVMNPDPEFLAAVESAATPDLASNFLFALMISGGLVVIMLVGGFAAHFIARAMRGQGSLTYTLEAIPSFLTKRIGICGAVAGVLSIAVFEMFMSQTGVYIMLGVPALILALSLLTLVNRAAQLYLTNPTVGFVASLPTITLIAGGALMVFMPLI